MESVHKEIGEVNRAEVIDLHAEDKGEEPYQPPVDTTREDAIFGNYLYQTPYTDREDLTEFVPVIYEVSRVERRITDKLYDQLRPLFLFTDKKVIEHTLTNTTQYGRNLLATHSIKENLKSRFPTNNVHCQHEPVRPTLCLQTSPRYIPEDAKWQHKGLSVAHNLELIEIHRTRRVYTTWNSSKSTGLEEYTHCAGEFTIHRR